MNEVAKIRTLVVDDEPHTRLKIRTLLARHSEVEVIGDCVNGYEAIAAIKEHAPDLVFLDVVMAEIDGFEVLTRTDEKLRPAVIFVTGYDKYALPAFDVHAVDFLLKPLARKRFDEALAQAKTWLAHKRDSDVVHRTVAMLKDLEASSSYRKRLVIKARGRVFFLNVDNIDWIQAEGKFVKLHVANESYLLREPIGALESELDPNKFLGIHRSYIVNIDYVRELQPMFNQEYLVVLRDGKELPLSQSGRKKLAGRLGISL